jgi:hypothetical protein
VVPESTATVADADAAAGAANQLERGAGRDPYPEHEDRGDYRCALRYLARRDECCLSDDRDGFYRCGQVARAILGELSDGKYAPNQEPPIYRERWWYAVGMTNFKGLQKRVPMGEIFTLDDNDILVSITGPVVENGQSFLIYNYVERQAPTTIQKARERIN